MKSLKFDVSNNTVIIIIIVILLIGTAVGVYFLVKPKKDENVESNVLNALCAREGCQYGYNCQKYNCRNCPECKNVDRLVG